MRAIGMVPAWALGVAWLSGSPAGGALRMNEILADPEGPDAGFEWVEFYNDGDAASALIGVSLESGNGSAPGQWKQVWHGQAGDWIAPRGFFVVGGPWRGRAPDSEAELELQNGPDGVRLLRDGLEVDRVGWGKLTWPEYYEADPAPPARSGRSLARRQDGADTNDNRADFEEAAPTPGRSNHPLVDLGVRFYRCGRPLPLPVGDGAFRAEVRIDNLGQRPVDLSEVTLSAGGRTLLPDPEGSQAVLGAAESFVLPVLLPVPPDPGVHRWSCALRLAQDEVAEDDVDTLRLFCGVPAVRFSELFPCPAEGESEWVELQVASGASPEGWELADRRGARLTVAASGEPAAAEFRILARDGTAVPGLAPGSLVNWHGVWPSLNDRALSGGAADTVFLYNPSGTVVDWAAYANTSRGSSWVRRIEPWASPGPDGWELSTIAGGTPGAPNPPVARAASPVDPGTCAPPACSLARDGAGVWICLPREVLPGSWELAVCDLNGHQVWGAAGTAQDRFSECARWNGRAAGAGICPAGVYILQLSCRNARGAGWKQQQTLVLDR